MGNNILFEKIVDSSILTGNTDKESFQSVTFNTETNSLEVKDITLGSGQTLTVNYQVRIDTESDTFVTDTWMLANGTTTFYPTYKHTTAVEFAVPAVKAPGVQLTIKKTWLNDLESQRPDTLSFTVYRGVEDPIDSGTIVDVEAIGTITMSKIEGNSIWEETFTQTDDERAFPKFNSSGKDYIYTLVEDSLDHYEEVSETKDGEIKDSEIEFSFTNQAKYELTILKVSSVNDQPLSGAAFELDGTFAEGKEGPVSLSASEEGSSFVLPAGYFLAENSTYTLTETQTPEGHKASGPWTIVVKDRQITIQDNAIEADVTLMSLTDKNEISYKISNEFTPLTLDVTKVNATDNQTLLAGAVFELTSDQGYKQSLTSDEKSHISFADLTPGEYTLIEVQAPNGYQITDDTWTFTIEIDGTVVYDDNEFHLSEDNLTLTKQVENQLKAFDLVVSKVDENEKSLEGAVFTLKKENADDLLEAEVSSNTFTITDLQPGKYELEEVTAPDNYIGLSETIEISITENGKVTVSGLAKNLVTNLTVSGNNQISFDVENLHATPLPATGGPGIWIYLVIGGMVISGAFVKRRTVFAKKGRD